MSKASDLLKSKLKETLSEYDISRSNKADGRIAEEVHEQLEEDYASDSLQWIKSAHWEGPLEVDLDQIDFSNKKNWQATKDKKQVAEFVDKILDGDLKPIILVNEPNDERLIVIDGHHRALAYEELDMPATAYVGHVGSTSGQWEKMHTEQRSSAIQSSRQK